MASEQPFRANLNSGQEGSSRTGLTISGPSGLKVPALCGANEAGTGALGAALARDEVSHRFLRDFLPTLSSARDGESLPKSPPAHAEECWER